MEIIGRWMTIPVPPKNDRLWDIFMKKLEGLIFTIFCMI